MVDARIDEALGSHQEAMDRLAQIPGVDRTGAMTFLAEAGPDMSVFPTSRHLAAWAGVCPGNNESAGKRNGKAKRRGNVHLTTALVQAAAAASRKKGSYLKEKFWRVKARRGYKRALLAVAHRILVSAYEMLSRSADYRDLGAEYLDKHRVTATRRRLVSQLKSLGYEVTLAPAATATA